MIIGEVARNTGVPTKTIRYYESIGLIGRAARHDNGYRGFSLGEVGSLRFIRRARHLGFSLSEVAELLALWRERDRASADVKALALRRVGEMEQRIAELESLRRTLVELAERCGGDHRPECPILDELTRG
jgi:MerR family copper efflux transcriptional regulator